NGLYGRDDVMVWVTGHSRGAAVANLLAAGLVGGEGPVGKGKVFAYTFATPNVTQNPAAGGAAAYGCIHNLINAEDFIAYMPLAEWGFGRYGVSYAYPGGFLVDDPGEYLSAVGGAYLTMTGFPAKAGGNGYPDLYAGLIAPIAELIPTRADYYGKAIISSATQGLTAAEFFGGVAGLMSGGTPSRGQLAAYMLGFSRIVPFFVSMDGQSVRFNDRVGTAHNPAMYVALTKPLGSGWEPVRDVSAFFVRVEGPADIEVLTGEGGMAGRVLGGEVDAPSIGGIAVYPDGDGFLLALPAGGGHSVRLAGAGRGRLSVAVWEVARLTGPMNPIKSFANVSVTEGKALWLTLGPVADGGAVSPGGSGSDGPDDPGVGDAGGSGGDAARAADPRLYVTVGGEVRLEVASDGREVAYGRGPGGGAYGGVDGWVIPAVAVPAAALAVLAAMRVRVRVRKAKKRI
ncbi:MAG: lipase family protein, partial [Oscillospiraceae bacterium]|nr:lipase family protein [Oscillospiraceae bacterium]